MKHNLLRDEIQKWIDEHAPQGLVRLALKSGVSVSTIEKAKAGRAPKRRSTRAQLAKALGLSVEELFQGEMPEMVSTEAS